MWKEGLLFLLLAFCNAQTFDRVLVNYPALTGNSLLAVDYNYNAQTISRIALQDARVGQLVNGALNLITSFGYVTADDANLWTLQLYNLTNPSYQLVVYSHATCLGEYFAKGPTPISALALDPTNMEVYITFQNVPGVDRYLYDGVGPVPFNYAQSGTTQLVIDYNGHILYFLPSAGSTTFNYLNLATNATGSVTAPGPISGGLAVDLATGFLYVATQTAIVSWSPATTTFATVYTSTSLVFRGIALDPSNNLMFFTAENQAGTSSSLYATSLSNPGTLTTLHSTLPQQFATVAVAHCTSATCGPCGAAVNNDASTIAGYFGLILLGLMLVF